MTYWRSLSTQTSKKERGSFDTLQRMVDYVRKTNGQEAVRDVLRTLNLLLGAPAPEEADELSRKVELYLNKYRFIELRPLDLKSVDEALFKNIVSGIDNLIELLKGAGAPTEKLKKIKTGLETPEKFTV